MDDKPFESLNMIPFIDIMLVLLTIVLTTSTFIASGKVPIHLPQASASVPDKAHSRVIEIDARGGIFLDGRPLAQQGLRAEIAPLPKDTPFLLRADKDVRLQRFVDMVDLLEHLGFARVAVQTVRGES
ncbi:biopolymer transporter ExbD [Trinickia dinghuensis]|uniref:Biopolymer transporter ExbD n=1 Tax=Trinickia dinghuensis TaxID=2291023 RepID=A0A3D8JQ37_9BURK|nr:biopolymer transporter ExbD [Trinickia dinghuensis]RDU95219.1 biopolymer transporter ExbD [Trinickia dinghuensis]